MTGNKKPACVLQNCRRKASIFIQIAFVVTGLAIVIGVYFYPFIPSKGLRIEIIALAMLVAAAFVLAALDRLTR